MSSLLLGSKATAFRGLLTFNDRFGGLHPLWECEHKHESHDEAEACAEIQLKHMLAASDIVKKNQADYAKGKP